MKEGPMIAFQDPSMLQLNRLMWRWDLLEMFRRDKVMVMKTSHHLKTKNKYREKVIGSLDIMTLYWSWRWHSGNEDGCMIR